MVYFIMYYIIYHTFPTETQLPVYDLRAAGREADKASEHVGACLRQRDILG